MFLSVFCQDDKKRIKTESGVYISATYKTNRYAKWKERSKMAQETEDYGEQEERWLCLFVSSFVNTCAGAPRGEQDLFLQITLQ